LSKVAFFLTTGEQAPISSVAEVYNMPIERRNYFVTQLNTMYEKQREEIERARSRK
jgi:hypothetical protein